MGSSMKKVVSWAYFAFQRKRLRNSHAKLSVSMMNNVTIDKVMLNREVIKVYRDRWKKLDPNPDPRYFLLYSSLRNCIDYNYIPDDLYRYTVENILNNQRYHAYYENKNIFERRLHEYRALLPFVYFRRIEGCFYDRDYNYISDIDEYLARIPEYEIIAKDALDTGSGRGVYTFRKEENNGSYINSDGTSLKTWMLNRKDAVVQKYCKQSSFLQKINPSSINTIRIVTYRSVIDNNVHIMQALIKRGAPGSLVDNLNSGGNFIEILPDGALQHYGVDKCCKKIPYDNDGCKVPLLNEIYGIAKEIASLDYFNRQLFYDFFVDDSNNVRIMEINHSVHPSIQAVCGPAFGPFTQEVIDHCSKAYGFMVVSIPYRAMVR